MLDDLAEGLLKGVLGAILRFLFWLIVEVFLFFSGEVVLYIATLGRRKPRWNSNVDEGVTKFWFRTDVSSLIGLIFWFAVLAVLGRVLHI
ncbi:MAG: hypothetical protein P1P84_13600 [Deferrisomatales bacterium]|nr:hypothetical protein [Deferrisomatales bacterium]